MKIIIRHYCLLLHLLLCCFVVSAQKPSLAELERKFLNPPPSAKPWVFWYWMHAAVSKEGITADLEAMRSVGIGGAYLMPIKDTSSAIPFQPVARQLTPEWWALVQFAMEEAKRLGLQLAMHVSDGFALAGGPWITPELSMQKLTWSRTYVSDASAGKISLSQPASNENYYRDIAVFAYPANSSHAFSNEVWVPTVTASNGSNPSYLSFAANGNETFRGDTACWIQYKYPRPFTCRSIRIHAGGNNYQANRLLIQSSQDGENFETVTRLAAPRHGWQNGDEDVTHAIPPTTARYFRFVYDKQGTEPGAEDLDAAKWKPSLRVSGIYLSDEPVIHQYESKNGSVWRVSTATTEKQVPADLAIPLKSIVDITGKMDAEGNLNWKVPAGNWVIVRVGHTSTGHTNATGGAGKGLECDKFNPAAIQLQFDSWFAKAFSNTAAGLAGEVLKIFHVDSWECGSQNWSPVFAAEFKKRRGYDLKPYLLAMTGVPIENAAVSEKFLHDLRQTIAELVNDVFYATLKKLAHAKGCQFSAESVAPTMLSDGMLHYSNVDIPMGEFWLNSPTHDKPNDMADAISGAHLYGKNIIQAEAFTSVRMNWGEHPGNIKALGDRNFAAGINKMVLHVFTHNPWLDKKPGMTLDGVGLYFQRDQTWFRQSKAWIDYLATCQALLQTGKPVMDIAVFTGEELPRRSILPDRLVQTLPGIFGEKRVASEKLRLENKGQPLREIPDGVTHTAKMADPEDWIDPLNGYSYDSFNPDALMRSSVKNGRIVLPGGASYAVLVIPGRHSMQPDHRKSSPAVLNKIRQLLKEGATVIMHSDFEEATGLQEKDSAIMRSMRVLEKSGNPRLIPVPYSESSFEKIGLPRDLEIIESDNSIAWTHRQWDDTDIYFISNQKDSIQSITANFRVTGKIPELWDPVTRQRQSIEGWKSYRGKTAIGITLHPNQSVFIVFGKQDIKPRSRNTGSVQTLSQPLAGKWTVRFDTVHGGPAEPIMFDELKSWSTYPDTRIRFYSGRAIYSNTFNWNGKAGRKVEIVIDSVFNIATVVVNGRDCGTIWTKPYSVDITKALNKDENKIEIMVSNTWANRLIGDQQLTPEKRIAWTTAPFRLKDKPLLPAGIAGKVSLVVTINAQQAGKGK